MQYIEFKCGELVQSFYYKDRRQISGLIDEATDWFCKIYESERYKHLDIPDPENCVVVPYDDNCYEYIERKFGEYVL